MQKTKTITLAIATSIAIIALIGITYTQFASAQNNTYNPQTPQQQTCIGTCTNQTLNCPTESCTNQTANCYCETYQYQNQTRQGYCANDSTQEYYGSNYGCHAAYGQDWNNLRGEMHGCLR
jgi:hypothetical protein